MAYGDAQGASGGLVTYPAAQAASSARFAGHEGLLRFGSQNKEIARRPYGDVADDDAPGGGFAVVWTSSKSGNDDIYFRRYDSNGATTDAQPILVGNANSKQDKAADVAALGDGTFVVTFERHDGADTDIYQSRFAVGAFSGETIVHAGNAVVTPEPEDAPRELREGMPL